jgi:GR25 family glycosyltransferase involved in LPS biosynthesis
MKEHKKMHIDEVNKINEEVNKINEINNNAIMNIDKQDAKNKFSDINIYWINLKRSYDRRQIMENMFNSIDLKNIRVEAYDGKIIDTYNNFVFIEDGNRLLSQYEKCCTISHFTAIKKAYDYDEEKIIVMEDDIGIKFIGYWESTMQQICDTAPKDWEIIKLHKLCKNYLYDLHGVKYIKIKLYHSNGAQCYIINRNGMKKIIDKYWNVDKNMWIIDYNCAVADVILYDNCISYDYNIPLFNPVMLPSQIRKGVNIYDKIIDKIINEYYNKI